MLPIITIVGRPNVGKSTLFNRILNQRKAIVHEKEGITRDRIYGEMEWSGHFLRFIDTGGYIPEDLELDTFQGKAYVGTIPFIMEKVRPHFLPYLPFISTFPEFNVRTYVKKNGKAGVLFLTLDAQSYVTCTYAPRAYGLPYKYAKANVKISEGTD